ncbi:hypothetical protein O4214_13460, partial [Rhodococcus erythropolis]|uniref:hypothetical protein n=1 Tax=Rhodococcus erythropolis TaxID=1833 RepID=UPI0022B59951
ASATNPVPGCSTTAENPPSGSKKRNNEGQRIVFAVQCLPGEHRGVRGERGGPTYEYEVRGSVLEFAVVIDTDVSGPG